MKNVKPMEKNRTDTACDQINHRIRLSDLFSQRHGICAMLGYYSTRLVGKLEQGISKRCVGHGLYFLKSVEGICNRINDQLDDRIEQRLIYHVWLDNRINSPILEFNAGVREVSR